MKKKKDRYNKKLVVEQGAPVEYKGDMFLGFVAILFILLAILGVLYYLEINNYINITDKL